MDRRVDNIYVYLWEEFNTIYIGRTINPKSRHYRHKHVSTETTYKFSSEHHVEHPKMIIIENDLTIEEGAKREKYWISEYRNNSPYFVLNKTKGGELGKKAFLTEEEKKKRKKEYYEINKKHFNEISKCYYSEHKEHLNNITKKYYEKNKEWLLALQRKYYHEHKEEIKDKRKDYFRKYNDSHKEKYKEYREENKEKISVYKKAYREANKEK